MSTLQRIVRQSGIAEALKPAAQVRHDAAIRSAIDIAGRPDPDAFRALIPPEVLRWGPGDTSYQATARPGRATLARVRCETAPTATATIRLRWESETTGLTDLVTVTVTAGRRFGPATVPLGASALPEGAWVGVEVVTASGATGISATLVVEPV